MLNGVSNRFLVICTEGIYKQGLGENIIKNENESEFRHAGCLTINATNFKNNNKILIGPCPTIKDKGDILVLYVFSVK